MTTPVVKIEKEGEERPTLLVLKDSYAHSTLSFLAQHYNLITVDIRGNLGFAAQLVESGQVDALLILASSSTLMPKPESSIFITISVLKRVFLKISERIF